MKLRHLAAWFSGVALLGTGATVLSAQPPQLPREGPGRVERDKLRAGVVKLRTEVEMLRLDYDLARDGLMEELKMVRGLKMAGEVMTVVAPLQAAINEAGSKPPGAAPRQESRQDRKKAAEAAKAAEQEEMKQAAEQAAYIVARKQELARLFTLLAEKQLDLEDAERNYRNFPERPAVLPR